MKNNNRMRKTKKEVMELIKTKIPADMRARLNILINKQVHNGVHKGWELIIHLPVWINVDTSDEQFEILVDVHTVKISNSKVALIIWYDEEVLPMVIIKREVIS